MGSFPRQPLPHLNVPHPMAFDAHHSMFTSGIPNSLPQSYHPNYPVNSGPALQTPMQSFFPAQPPGAPGRPSYVQHRGHASIAHLPLGIHASNTLSVAPLGQGFPNSMMLGGSMPFGQQFMPRSRRTPSISVGGPPKAALGGPGRKHSPLPIAAFTTPAAGSTAKGKKVVVNIPVETVTGDDGDPLTRPSWARTPLPLGSVSDEPHPLEPPDLTTTEAYPPDEWRYRIPDSVDVFLPGKNGWVEMKQQVIEAKLEKLGVERASGFPASMHAPHGRSNSISSPADPSLLYFKLNKLQQSQNASASNSLSASPQPPVALSPSPNLQMPARFQGRHGHSMSLAQPPTFQQLQYNPTAAFNPFGPNATLGSDQITKEGSEETSVEGIYAPQGRVPVTVSSLAPPSNTGRPDSRPDFHRGFGLDIPEEEEEEEYLGDDDLKGVSVRQEYDGVAVEDDDFEIRESSFETQPDHDDMTALAQSRLHSRHVSRLSNALSLRSVGGIAEGAFSEAVDVVPLRKAAGDPDIDDLDKEAVGEWTGSEDLHLGQEQSDDEESIGEWSNPSDEERARQESARHRFERRGLAEGEMPRRIPNFPRPPDTAFGVPITRDVDVVSNPSEEERYNAQQHSHFLTTGASEFFVRPSSTSTPGRIPFPLPPLPHSRHASSQLSGHDPALAHSRSTSEHITQPVLALAHSSRPSITSGTLNPFAKPFVFGTGRQSGSWSAEANQSTDPPGHLRTQSSSRPLNAAAQEFKPGGFTFRPPAGVPHLSFPGVEPARALPVTPPEQPLGREQQGREKRQRREGSSSSAELEDEEGKNTMFSFKFPLATSPSQNVRRSAPTTPQVVDSLGHQAQDSRAQPLTFSGFPSVMSSAAQESETTLTPSKPKEEQSVNMDGEHAVEYESPVETTSLAQVKSRRAPIPLDFKHPHSSNTVPAGLFKALAGDERTRRTVRSRLGSREFFEHAQRPSLDDLNVPTISRKISRNRLVTDPPKLDAQQDQADIFTPSIKRRSSLPALHSGHNSSVSEISTPVVNLTAQLEVQRYQGTLEVLLDQKFKALLQELSKLQGSGVEPSVSNSISEVVSLFRAQLEESAARGLDDSQMDARGELDFELIKDLIQQGHAEARALMRQELNDVMKRLELRPHLRTPSLPKDLVSQLEQMNTRSVQVVVHAISRLSAQLEDGPSPHTSLYDNDVLIHGLVSALSPLIKQLRPEPIDYDILTGQLSQAVKPNISQLIDLASDKRETASLIIDSLIPLIPQIAAAAPALDTDALVAQVATEVRHVIAPLDAHEIKEQVADLVVERLDSRLAVRDKAFNVDLVSDKVNERVLSLIEPVTSILPKLQLLVEGQETLSVKSDSLFATNHEVAGLISNLSAQFCDIAQALHSPGSDDEVKQVLRESQEKSTENLQRIESMLDAISDGQKSFLYRSDELIAQSKSTHQDVVQRLGELPETLNAAVGAMQAAHAEFMAFHDASKRDLEESRRLQLANNDLQVQLAKARSAHGQVRVEKDNLSEKYRIAEAEKEQMRIQIEELQVKAKDHAAAMASAELRTSELEEALSQSLARLKSSDVAQQSDRDHIIELEKIHLELESENEDLKEKVDSMELQAKLLFRDKESTMQALTALQKEHDNLLSQRAHWDDLHRTTEQLEQLTNLINRSHNEELEELRRFRDHCKVLESENSALQRRIKENESKAVNSERAANTAKQSLAQAQQRAAEWERRAKEYEGELETTSFKLDQIEQAHTQLEADFSLVRLQLEESQAEDRLVKDRESQLKDQVATLESRVTRLQAEATKAAAKPSLTLQNGTAKIQSPPRPDSRASTVFGGRSSTPTNRMNGSRPRSDTPPQSSVWDSMHAPKQYADYVPVPTYARRSQAQHRVASPALSTVSMAPTQGDDGWWS